VRNKFYKFCKSEFCHKYHKYHGIRVLASSAISKLVKKVSSTESFLDKKYTRQNTVLSEEMLARLVHSPHKSLAQSAKQVHVMRTTVWRATKRLNLWPYKITKVHATEEGDCK
jgi:hypothetical protein